MRSNLIKINPKVLEWARKKARLSQDLLAQKVGVKRNKYLEWELGQSFPDMHELHKIALHLRCPVLIFLCLGVLR